MSAYFFAFAAAGPAPSRGPLGRQGCPVSFWLIQALGLTGSLISLTSLQSRSRRNILLLQVFCCVLWITHYALLGAFTGVLTNLLGLLRGIVCANNHRRWASSRWWLAFFLVCYGLSPLLTWDGPHCLLLGLAMMLTTLALWVRNMPLTRLLFLLNSPLVFTYNLMAGSYACAAIEVVAFSSFLLAVWRFDIRRKGAGEAARPSP